MLVWLGDARRCNVASFPRHTRPRDRHIYVHVGGRCPWPVARPARRTHVFFLRFIVAPPPLSSVRVLFICVDKNALKRQYYSLTASRETARADDCRVFSFFLFHFN
jgi:hypothetical protein